MTDRFSRVAATLLVLVMALTSAVSCAQHEAAGEKIGVVVTILPQAEFVENVGGERVDVTVMVPPGASPHSYEPAPSQIAAVARAGMYAGAGSGIDFELVWMDKLIAVNKKMLVVDCSEGVSLQEMVELHGAEGEHGHGALDPHIWMSPRNAGIMVRNICNGLVQVDPANKAYYEHNRDSYIDELTRLDSDIRKGLAGIKNRSFMVYHPSFGYFAREYNLDMIPIEEEGKEPTAADIADLIEYAGEHKIRVIFASPQFNPQSAGVIADEIGGSVVFIDPLARDYIANLRFILGEMVQVME